MRTRLPLAVSHIKTRRVKAAAKRARNVGHVFGRIRRDRSVQPIQSAQKRPVTSSATASLIRRSQPVMHRRIRLRDVPLPARVFAAWPIRVVLPSARVGGAHGVQRPSQVCSRDGWPVISDRPGPPACSSNRAPRLIFVGSICRGLREQENRNWRQIARATGLASGLHSRLRSVSPGIRQTTMSAATLEDRSCLGLCLSQGCGHGFVQTGRARPRPDHPTPRAP